MARKRTYTDNQLAEAIKDSISWRAALIALGLNGDAGGNVASIQRQANELGLDYSHFKGSGWNLGGIAVNAHALEDCLTNKIPIRSRLLKNKLLKAGLIEEKCVECGIPSEWNGKPLVLELDHVDGDKHNNVLNNLRLLCPNCHSQTPTFRGRKL